MNQNKLIYRIFLVKNKHKIINNNKLEITKFLEFLR